MMMSVCYQKFYLNKIISDCHKTFRECPNTNCEGQTDRHQQTLLKFNLDKAFSNLLNLHQALKNILQTFFDFQKVSQIFLKTSLSSIKLFQTFKTFSNFLKLSETL